MEFLPSLEDDNQVVEKKGYRKNPKMRLCKERKPLKLNSMPVVERKLEEYQQENFELEREYRLLNVLGAGTYSKVHLAERLSDNKQFAIKISKGATSGSLLQQEYELLKEVEDPIIPKAIDFRRNWILNTSYFIMEYFEGQQLDNFIEERGKLSDEEAMKCIKSLCDWVARLHSKGIAHRDTAIYEEFGQVKIKLLKYLLIRLMNLCTTIIFIKENRIFIIFLADFISIMYNYRSIRFN